MLKSFLIMLSESIAPSPVTAPLCDHSVADGSRARTSPRPASVPPHHAPHRLNELRAGARGKVCRIEGHDGAMHRLMAMGLCVGREVEVVRQGNPLIVRLLGARIGVSSRIAQHIFVESKG